MARAAISESIKRQVLMEAGYRCAVPTCRNILAIDLHHLVAVSESGGNVLANLLALCPTCHALYERGTISRDAIYAYKGMVVALGHAFDQVTIDGLLFLANLQGQELLLSGDGVLQFMRLIANGLAKFTPSWGSPAIAPGGRVVSVGHDMYQVWLTNKGRMLVDAWKAGNRAAVARALAEPSGNTPSPSGDNPASEK